MQQTTQEVPNANKNRTVIRKTVTAYKRFATIKYTSKNMTQNIIHKPNIKFFNLLVKTDSRHICRGISRHLLSRYYANIMCVISLLLNVSITGKTICN
jgi:hypothetical protein